jgi:hypothetical protein
MVLGSTVASDLPTPAFAMCDAGVAACGERRGLLSNRLTIAPIIAAPIAELEISTKLPIGWSIEAPKGNHKASAPQDSASRLSAIRKSILRKMIPKRNKQTAKPVHPKLA